MSFSKTPCSDMHLFRLLFIREQMRFTSQWTRFHLRFIVVHISEGKIRVNATHDHSNYPRKRKKYLRKNFTNSRNFVKKGSNMTINLPIPTCRVTKINILKSVLCVRFQGVLGRA